LILNNASQRRSSAVNVTLPAVVAERRPTAVLLSIDGTDRRAMSITEMKLLYAVMRAVIAAD